MSTDKAPRSKPPFLLSTRFLCVCLLFFGYSFNFMQKIDMGIAVVCMTNHTALQLQKQQIFNLTLQHQQGELLTPTIAKKSTIQQEEDQCPTSSSIRQKKEYHDGEFVWSDRTKGFLLSAYFYGYIFMQVRFVAWGF